MRNKKTIFAVVLVFFLFLAFVPQKAPIRGVEGTNQRKVLLELFTSTWCGPCASYSHYVDETYDYFGKEKVVLVRNQVWQDGLDTPETNTRCEFYGVNGVPTLYVNGQYSYHPMNYSDYRAKINEMLNKPAQVSIVLDPQISSGGNFINLNIEVKLIESISVENLNLVVALYEKQVNYTGLNKVPTHRFVIRDYIFDEIGSKINFINGVAKINMPVLLKRGSKPEDFGVAAWVQDMKTREVLQVESSDIKINSNILPPLVILPQNGSFIKDFPVLVKLVGDGDTYRIEISDKEDFSNIVFSKETQQTEEKIDSLRNETTYFLRVKSRRGNSESDFSSVINFTITSKIKQGAQFKNLNNGDLYGGTINALLQNPVNSNILYVGSEGGGVFKSIDGGKTWTQKNFGLDDLYVRSLQLDPDNPNRIFAGTKGGLFISEDEGNTWLYYGLSDIKSIIYVAKTKKLFLLTGKDLYISLDGGFSFVSISPKNLIDYYFYYFAVDKTNDSRIFLTGYSYATSSGFLYKTIDGGKNWDTVSLDFLQNSLIYDITIENSNSSIIYLASIDLYKSTDGGSTFSKLVTPKNYIYSITVDEKNPRRVAIISLSRYIYLSNDSGATWTSLNTSFEIGNPKKLFFDIQDNDKLYVCSDKGGIYYSIDGGKSFTGYNQGLYAIKVSKIVKTPNIVAITSSGTFNLLNYNWVIMNSYSFSEPDKIKQNPQNPLEIIVLSPIFWSKDGGKTWEYHKLGNGLFSYTFDVDFKNKTLFFVYRNNSKWYLGKSDFNGNVTESYEIPSQRISWIYQILVDQVNPTNIYLAVGVNWNSSLRKYEGSGLLKSTDGGKTFQEYAFKEDSVVKVFIDVNNQNSLFANTWYGCYKSVDKGVNWKKVSYSHALAMGFAPDNKTIYAAFEKSLAVSTDYGDSWIYIPWDYSINFSRPQINDILVDKDNPDIVYISTDGSGVYMYFIPNTRNFTITSSSSLGGTITPSGTITVNYGDSKTFNITPNPGYKIKDV
ncbi:VPS10 domain-containing protein, partial [Caldisericum sp.]|uniref:VPS10 domain-containing protein n=1 Tax=Caldisericum sp. TaxID=2499687 RepID=UPI003D126BF4